MKTNYPAGYKIPIRSLVLILTGAIIMKTTSAQNLFDLPTEQTLDLNSALAVGASNALERFRATQQPLEYFTVIVEESEDLKIVTISFVAKLEPGKMGLGSTNRMGNGVTTAYAEAMAR